MVPRITETPGQNPALEEEFRLDQQRIANHCDPPRTRVTVATVSRHDERLLTETNVARD
jgi:hypothetical protein